MNSSKPLNGAGPVTVQERLGDWHQLIDRCRRKPTRKRVHALRVSTLRLQAELDIDLAEVPRASHEAQAVLQFTREGQKLRRVLGPVREHDVWVGKLQRLRQSLLQSGAYVPRTTRGCVRQLEQFESRLKQDRRQLEKKLIAAIERRRESLAALTQIDLGIAASVNGGGDAARNIRARFARVAKNFPSFDEENLHEFRKRIKMVRYLAEMHQQDKACAQIAAQMKKLQSTIGEWHDWQALAREVRRHGSKTDAAELLAAIAAESLEAALTNCRTITHRLLAEDAEVPEAVVGRKAPGRADHLLSEAADRKLA
jgi:CHAD domain-containing protein